MTKSTINSAIKKMERDEILYLTPGPGRNTCVYLTEKGQKLAERTVYKVFEIENAVYESWSEEEQQTLLRLTRDCAEKMEQMIKKL